MTDNKHPPIKSFTEYQNELAIKAHAGVEQDYLSRLRDEFAMAALQALITHYGNEIPNGEGYKECAWEAYKFADAMMEARKK